MKMSSISLHEIIAQSVNLHNTGNVDGALKLLSEGLKTFPAAPDLLWRRGRWRCAKAEKMEDRIEVREKHYII